MKRLRHILASTLLLLGLVYFFVQHGSLSLSAGPGKLPTVVSPDTQQKHDLPEEDSGHEDDTSLPEALLDDAPPPEEGPPISNIPASNNIPSESISGDKEVDSLPPPLIDINFQQDLDLSLPVDTWSSLSEYTPENYNPNGVNSYTYATFFASRNPSVEDPYYLAIHSVVYRTLWSPRSKTLKYPFIVFVGDFVSEKQRQLLRGAGAIVRELAPLPWNPTDPGVLDRWKDLFAKLNMWNETDFSRILFLDADAFPVAPIDDMFELTEERLCIDSNLQLDDFLPDGEKVCDPYIFAGVPADPYSIFDANINVGSMVFTPNTKQHQRLLQNYLKIDKYDVKMAEQAFLNWQFGINSAYPPGMLEREYGAFFPNEEEHGRLKVVHEKIWAAERGWMKEEWENTWQEMLKFYASEEFREKRMTGSGVGG